MSVSLVVMSPEKCSPNVRTEDFMFLTQVRCFRCKKEFNRSFSFDLLDPWDIKIKCIFCGGKTDIMPQA